MTWMTFFMLCAVTFCVSRLIVQETIIKEVRERVISWIALGKVNFDDEGKPSYGKRRLPVWRDKLVKLVNCPYCVSIHVAGYVVLIHHFFISPLPYPIWVWLGVRTGALIIWEFIDGT